MIHNNRRNQKKQSGITLVALVVTIVILIILATITINVVFDDGGLIDIVKGAKNNAEDLVQSEDKKMNDLLQEYANIMGGNVEIPEPDPEVDTIPPIVTVTSEGITTNSITVNVQATDNESGMKENPTYTYYIKKSSEADSSYQVKAIDVTNSSYTFTGLQQERSYDIKVEVNGDKAGNKGTGTLTGQVTTKVPGGETGVEEGAITFGSTTWSGGKASITISTNTGMQIQYQVDSTSGNWTNISNGGTIGSLQHGQTVYARLTDGTNYGDYASASIVDRTKPNAPTITLSGTNGANGWYKSDVTVKITAGSDGQSGANKVRYKVTGAQTIAQTDTAGETTSTSITVSADGTSTITAYTIDKVGNISVAKTQLINKDETVPTASISVGTKNQNSIAVTVNAVDSTSGLATSGTYKYYLNNEGTPRTISTSNSYTYTGLTAGTSYTLRVVVTDKAGNEKTVSTSESTEKKLATNLNELEEGNYVNYVDKNGVTRECVVLYDSSSGYGVQIIAKDTVTNVMLGHDSNFTTSKNSYNNAVKTLNDAASAYNNSTYSSRARCVGSHPTSTSDTTSYFSSSYSYMSKYNGQFKNEDENGEIEYNQMKVLEINNIGKGYWLASRNVFSGSLDSNFDVRYVSSSGFLSSNYLFHVFSGSGPFLRSCSNGLRPVFVLKSGIKVTGGNGEESSPYTLGT